MLNPEAPSIYMDACQLRLSEQEVMREKSNISMGKNPPFRLSKGWSRVPRWYLSRLLFSEAIVDTFWCFTKEAKIY